MALSASQRVSYLKEIGKRLGAEEWPLIDVTLSQFELPTNNEWGSGYGTVYRMTPQGVLTVLQTFDGTNGTQPFAPLVKASDGNLYGITSSSSISSGALSE
jgi:uncharacterized repeat protein (TIGR03803 family)